MSRLFPETVDIHLAPAAITVGGRTIACDPDFGAEPWQGALAALKSVQFKEQARVAVVLSNAFVRYALVPPSAALDDEAEEQAYVRHHFAKVHGERAKSWVFRWSGALASAIDRRLLDALKASIAPDGKARLASVQPALMAAFNRWVEEFPPAGAWLVLAERERACAALYVRGSWRSVQNAKGDWLELLERERHRAEGPVPELVLLVGAAAPRVDSWNIRELRA
ncbi:MAG: hypothetical protein ABI423_05680 [Burkholderiales bacterium]